MLFREDIITATTNTCTLQEDLRWHTEWECDVLSPTCAVLARESRYLQWICGQIFWPRIGV